MYALELVNAALNTEDPMELIKVLKMPHLGLRDVKEENAEFYLHRISEARDFKKVLVPGPSVSLIMLFLGFCVFSESYDVGF